MCSLFFSSKEKEVFYTDIGQVREIAFYAVLKAYAAI